MLYEKLLAKFISCPECKGEMHEVHRAQENGIVFIWLECLRSDCSGQWLQRIPQLVKTQETGVTQTAAHH
jgi:hypothetical protein